MIPFARISKNILQWEYWDKPQMVIILVYLICSVNYKDSIWKGITIGRGQTFTSLKSISKATSLSEKVVRNGLAKLEESGTISMSSSKQGRLITLNNYEKYNGTYKAKNLDISAPTEDVHETKKEILTIFQRKNFTEPDKEVEKFWNYYDATGWMQNGTPVKNKLSLARIWQQKSTKTNIGSKPLTKEKIVINEIKDAHPDLNKIFNGLYLKADKHTVKLIIGRNSNKDVEMNPYSNIWRPIINKHYKGLKLEVIP